MRGMYFQRLDARDTDPALFVDRERDQQWLHAGLEAYLNERAPDRGRSFVVIGAKGSGKTIFARRVIASVRKKFLSNTLFIEVDCRRQASSRAVFNIVAQSIVDELQKLSHAGAKVRPALLDAAKMLTAVTRFTEVELKVAHEHTMQFKAAVSATPKLGVLQKLEATFGLSLENVEKRVKTLTGKVTFDEAGLCAAIKELLADIRHAGFSVLLFVDNVDELHHDYKDDATRRRVFQEAEWVIELAQAPVAMVACMRSYYSGVARALQKRALDPLAAPYLKGVLERRVREESDEVRRWFTTAPAQAMANEVSKHAPTPLACLQWFQWFAEEDAYDPDAMERTAERLLRAEYANVPLDTLRRIAQSFKRPTDEIDRAQLLAACGESESELATVQDRQVVLPNDFFNPTRFTLDPTVFVLHRAFR